jgi:hypothetical protein
MKRRSDEGSEKWKSSASSRLSSNNQIKAVLFGSLTDLRKVGVLAVGWYLWLIWY